MPTYLYQHPSSGEIIEIIQSIHDEHKYIDKDKIEWNRIFTVPQLNTQERLTEESTEKDFSRVTSSQKGTLGDLWDRSKELSEKRKKKFGQDPVEKDYYKKWSKKRRNRIHPNSKSE